MRVAKYLVGLIAAVLFLACDANAKNTDLCSQRTFENSRFTVCTVDPRHQTIEIDWLGPNNRPLRSLPALRAAFAQFGPHMLDIRFAMNAGMFDENGAPIGLMVDVGKVFHPLNTKSGDGNFYMKPNGVFAVELDGTIAIRTTDAFRASGDKPYVATQSGPMLVIDNQLNPAIAKDGPSRYIRNGVGRGPRGSALFVISDEPVSFGKLARFMRDSLKCRDALYLDGAVLSLWNPATGRMDQSSQIGPMFVIRDED